jgi:hypothetical protein
MIRIMTNSRGRPTNARLDAQAGRMARAYMRGDSLRVIARRHACSYGSARARVLAAGATLRPPGGRKATATLIETTRKDDR